MAGRNGNYRLLQLMFLLLFFTQGCEKQPEQALGTLEWDRVNSRIPASEIIEKIAVKEGQRVEAGDLLLTIDDRKIVQQYHEVEALLKQATWKLRELETGPRPQTIAEAKARLEAAKATLENDKEIYARRKQLYKTEFTSQEQRDISYNAYINSKERVTELTEELDELLAGTRIEQIEQAKSQVVSLTARLSGLELLKEDYTIIATRSGLVDSLPFKSGDKPPAHSVVCTLLAGDRPWARVYIPEAYRSRMKPGALYNLMIDGQQQPFNAQLRSISSEASFTPYFALSEKDRSRLSYIGQFDLTDENAQELTAGSPVQLILEAP